MTARSPLHPPGALLWNLGCLAAGALHVLFGQAVVLPFLPGGGRRR